MILGVGTDLAEISFFRQCLLDNKTKFINEVFTAQEITTSHNGNTPAADRLAARFAVKEAFYKALSQITLHQDYQKLPFNPKEIEVCNDNIGRPFLSLTGVTLKLTEEKKVKKHHISISHEKEYAIAFVVLE